jgi:pyruvate formate lyase activating enzyme
MEATGIILHTQRLSTEDGPGIRTTVFFKGCPLSCAWCHNPESISSKPQVQWLENHCIACHTCLEVCLDGCLSNGGEGIIIDRQRCQGCGECTKECPANAMELLGTSTSAVELLPELLKDRAYYGQSGGVTLSGGEPTLQASFAVELLAGLKAAQVHTALDTCGLCARPVLERLYPLVDLFLFDLKLIDSTRHRQHTGQDNSIILDNLHWLTRRIAGEQNGKKLWIRTPLIPGATDDPENITAIGRFIANETGGSIARWELCAFNNLCRDKYRRLGIEWAYASSPLLTQEELDRAGATARASGINPSIVFVTGATKIQKTTG